MNDPAADVARRDRMAIVLASIEARTGAIFVGKKERARRAAESAGVGTEWGNDLNWSAPSSPPI